MSSAFEGLSAHEIVRNELAERRNPILLNLPGDAAKGRVEIQKLLDAQPSLIVDRQYGDVCETLQHFELVDAHGQPIRGGLRLPEAGAVVDSFSVDQLKLAVSQNFRNPTFLLVPRTHFLRIVEAIDSHRLLGQNPTLLADPFRDDPHSDSIEVWTPMIAEGAKGAKATERLGATNLKLTDFVQQSREKRAAVSPYFCGMDRCAYALLMMISMKHANSVNDLIDRNGATILDGDPALDLNPDTRRGIPIGKYRKFDPPEYPHENAVRFYMSEGHIGGYAGYGGHWMRNALVGRSIAA